LEKGGWEGFEKLSLSKLAFQIHLNPLFLKGEENAFANFLFDSLPLSVAFLNHKQSKNFELLTKLGFESIIECFSESTYFLKQSTLTTQGTKMQLLLVIQAKTQKSDGNSFFSQSIVDVVTFINKQEIHFNKFYQEDDTMPSLYKRLTIINKLEEFGLSLTATETEVTNISGSSSCIYYFFKVPYTISVEHVLQKIKQEFCIP